MKRKQIFKSEFHPQELLSWMLKFNFIHERRLLNDARNHALPENLKDSSPPHWRIETRLPRSARKIRYKYTRYQNGADIKILYDAYSQLWYESEKYIRRHEDKSGLQTRVILIGWMHPSHVTLLRGYLLLIKLLGADLNFRFGWERPDVAKALGNSYLKSGFKIEFASDLSPRFRVFRTFMGYGFRAYALSEQTKASLQNLNHLNAIENSNSKSVLNVLIDSILTQKVEKNLTNKFRRMLLLPPENLAVHALMHQNMDILISFLRGFRLPNLAEILASKVPNRFQDRFHFLAEVYPSGNTESSIILNVKRLYKHSDPESFVNGQVRFPTIDYKKIIGHALPGNIPVESDLIELTELTDVKIQKGGTIICDHELVVVDRAADPRLEHVSGQWEHVFGSSLLGQTVMVELCEDTAESIDKGILLSGRNDYNWYHWMVEYLPRVIEIDKEIDSRIPWVISNRVPTTGVEALKMISTRDILVCDSEKLQHFKKLIVMSPNASIIDTVLAPWERISRFNTHNLQELRSAMRSVSSSSRFPEKVFIVRESIRRNIVNQDQLVATALGYGFRPISLDNLDFSEQLDLFSNAKVIITAGGAVMANYLFMPQESHVIQLNNLANKDFIIPPLLCSIAGSNFTSILGKPKKAKKIRHLRVDQIHESYAINPRILESVLESINESSTS